MTQQHNQTKRVSRAVIVVPLVVFVVGTLGLLVSASNRSVVATGRIGFVADIAYFELEPVRNMLVSHVSSGDLERALERSGPIGDVELTGEEAYRPIGYFELTARGEDPALVVDVLDRALVELVDWANEQRAETGLSDTERPMMVVVRPATEESTSGPVGWALLGGLTLAVCTAVVMALPTPRENSTLGDVAV